MDVEEAEPVCPYNLTPVARLSDREQYRLKERAKREAVLRAGSMVFDDLTGRTYFNKGTHDPSLKGGVRRTFMEHRERAERARING